MARTVARLSRAHPAAVVVGTLAYLLAALFTPGVPGAALLVALVCALCGWASLTWPRRPAGLRLVQALVIAGLAAAALAKLG